MKVKTIRGLLVAGAMLASVAAAAARRGLMFASLERSPREGRVMRPAERDRLVKWLLGLPKPCGVLAWTDLLAKEVMDACREDPKRLKAMETLLAGRGNPVEIVCRVRQVKGLDSAGEEESRSASRLKAVFRERYGMTMREWRKLHRK